MPIYGHLSELHLPVVSALRSGWTRASTRKPSGRLCPGSNSTTVSSIFVSTRSLGSSVRTFLRPEILPTRMMCRIPLACGKCGNAGRCVEGGFFANQPAIIQMEDAIAVGEHARVVSDHDDRTSMVMRKALQECDHGAAAGGIKRGGRFVSEQNGRIARESTGNGDALFQSAAQVGGQFGGTFAF
jgi:hypothetical protein